MRPVKTKIFIGGMSCVHCQDKIESGLLNTNGILSATVSYGDGTADVTYDEEIISIDDIHKLIEDLDYRVLPEKGGDKSCKTLLYPFAVFAVIVAAFVPLQYFGLLNYLAPSDLADSSMGFGMLFVIGLITSVHCIAMCGGINLSQCIPKSEESVQKGFKTFIPALLYNLGRVVSYTLIGLILGFVGWIAGGGTSVGVSMILQGAFKIVAGLLMIIMGVNMLGIIPALRKLNVRMPKFLARKIGKKKAQSASPLIVGLLNGLMPCGPLQSMWIVALASGNPFSGALSMFLFALGTVPLMLGLGSIVAKLGQKFTKAVMTVGSLLVVILGLAMLSQGGSLTGISALSPVVVASVVLALILAGVICSVPLTQHGLKIVMRVAACCLVAVVGIFAFWVDNRNAVDGSYDVSVVSDGKQTVTSTLEPGTYPNISVKKNIPVEWIINAPEGSINGCNYKFVIQDFGIEYEFRYGENIIEFTPETAGSFSYSCWMGMIYGTIVVNE